MSLEHVVFLFLLQMLFIECSIVFFILYVSDLANQGTLSGMSCVIELSQLSRALARRTNSRCLLWRVTVGPRTLDELDRLLKRPES